MALSCVNKCELVFILSFIVFPNVLDYLDLFVLLILIESLYMINEIIHSYVFCFLFGNLLLFFLHQE